MAYNIVYTPLIKSTLRNMANNIPMIYSARVFNKLVVGIKHTVELFADSPFIGQVEIVLESFTSKYRRIVVKPYFKLIYYIEDSDVYLSDVWDTRQDPKLLISRLEI